MHTDSTDKKLEFRQRAESALSIAKRGWPVFPVHGIKNGACTCGKQSCSAPGKHPSTPNGLKDASTDAEEIWNTWQDSPDDNIGIALPDGVIAVDVDPRNGGDTAIAELEAVHGALPPTLVCDTGGGGQHYYFAVAPGTRLPGKLAQGIDLKQLGGYTIAPPSLHVSGKRYLWRHPKAELAPLPLWVAEAAGTKPAKTAPAPKSEPAAPKPTEGKPTTVYGWKALEGECLAVARAPNGEQESTLNAAALKIGSLIAGGEIAESDATELLLAAGLAMINYKPSSPWTEEQIAAKLARGFEHGAQSPRSATDQGLRAFGQQIAKEHPPEGPIASVSSTKPARHQIHYQEEREFEAVDAAIVALSDSSIYQRGGLLTHIAADLAPERAILREKDTPRICVVSPARLREELSRCADWTKQVWTKDGASERMIAVPRNVVEAVIARDAWIGIRALHGIADFPIVRPDGGIVSAEGYDSATGVYVAPSCAVVLPAGSPGELANWVLDELVGDFPFASPAHRSSWFAALLTPIARHAFEGPAPLVLIDKNVRGSGGSLLADLIGIVCSGRALPRMGQQTDEYQETNRLLGLAVAGDPFALIDNVNQPLGNGALDRVLTGTSLKERWLGGNKIVTASWNCLLLATGNNIQLVGDTARRALHVRLESPEEQPENRSGFRHPNLKAWARDNRGRLLGALLAILSGYLKSGSQPPKPWGSFEGWSDVVRGAVVWCGLPDPYDGRSELVAVDSEAETVRALIRGLEELEATSEAKAVTVRDIVDDLGRPSSLTDAISALDEKHDAKKLGYGIRKFKGRVVDGKKLASCKHTKQNVAAWYVA